MKIELHVPVEQYGFVSGTFETENLELIRQKYDEIKESFTVKPPSLGDKEMTDFIHDMLHGKKYHIETWEQMNPAQKVFINQLKKAQSRKAPLSN